MVDERVAYTSSTLADACLVFVVFVALLLLIAGIYFFVTLFWGFFCRHFNLTKLLAF